MITELPFGSTSLKKDILDILKEDGFISMSPVQAKTIPLLLKGNNVLSLAPTGTGKTLAYALPILNDLEDTGTVQAVIISPTVALLDQIKSVFEEFTLRLGFKADAVKAIYSQNDFKRSRPDVVMITPELYPSLCSHYPINKLKRVIIDEGDMVAFDGFKDALEALKKQKEAHMISFFSASLNEQDIKRVKKAFSINAVVDVRDAITSKSVKHHLIDIRTNSKAQALDQASSAQLHKPADAACKQQHCLRRSQDRQARLEIASRRQDRCREDQPRTARCKGFPGFRRQEPAQQQQRHHGYRRRQRRHGHIQRENDGAEQRHIGDAEQALKKQIGACRRDRRQNEKVQHTEGSQFPCGRWCGQHPAQVPPGRQAP